MKFNEKEIAAACGAEVLKSKSDELKFGISTDTRTIKAGEIYLPLKGETFDGEKFVGKELTKEQVQTLFPDVTILPVSEFKDNEITIESPIFRKRAYMLWNDTERDFYKYQFEYYKKNNGFFKGIIETAFPRTFVYSHFKSRDEMFPILKINIKPVLKEPAQTDEETPESENAGTESDAPETN